MNRPLIVARQSCPYNGYNVPLGLYISIPFCRTKCSYCNFASDVFSKSAYENYVRRVLEDIASSRALAAKLGGAFDEHVDSIYLGGGTPSILEALQLSRIFDAVRDQFTVAPGAEITVECAPGTLTDSLIEALLCAGVNRVSLGVQSFVDQEAQSVGRRHKRSTVLEEVARLRAAGLDNINIDLITGLPHQTAASWTFSLAETIALGVPHASVYMLEVDEDSRLGRELIAGGARYHAHFVPDDAATADFYLQACETLNSAGIAQYEISNFARLGLPGVVDGSGFSARGWESRHNLKYWTRQPYFGFGVDAHSMLRARSEGFSGTDRTVTSAAEAAEEEAGPTAALKRCATQSPGFEAIRFATPDSLDAYMNRAPHAATVVSTRAAIEESFFLGLRLNCGVDLDALQKEFTADAISVLEPAIHECLLQELLEERGAQVRLTDRGRLLSNEVFARFLMEEAKSGAGHALPR